MNARAAFELIRERCYQGAVVAELLSVACCTDMRGLNTANAISTLLDLDEAFEILDEHLADLHAD